VIDAEVTRTGARLGTWFSSVSRPVAGSIENALTVPVGSPFSR
jgi:hypothetical protein